MSRARLSVGLFAVVAVSALSAVPAQAHINMTGANLARGGDQKAFPCDGARGAGPIYTYAPGSTITLSLDEQIPHPSYFRIAFDNDGEDDFKEPLSIDPIEATRDPNGKCMKDKLDHCGESDFCSFESSDGPTVLWDNLDPHTAQLFKSWSWNVKLPDIECDNCTIQIIQVMEDSNAHGPYCVHGNDCTGDTSLPDIYHRCIDIKLVKGAKNGPGATTAAVANKGRQCGTDGTTTPAPDETDPGTGTSDPTGQTGDPSDPADPPEDADDVSARDASTGSSGSTRKDSGTKDSGTKGGKDAGASSADDEPSSGGSDGCAVAQGSRSGAGGAVCSLLALAACLVRRRRRSV